jgi:hypothetical protein
MSIKALYSVTEACIKLSNNLKSSWFTTVFGERQGDSLSPTLFSMFLSDLTEEINHLNVGINNG